MVCVLPLNLPTWGPKWSWWRRGTLSPGTTCCTSGLSPSMTCEAWEPRSSMGSFVPVPSTISVSGASGGTPCGEGADWGGVFLHIVESPGYSILQVSGGSSHPTDRRLVPDPVLCPLGWKHHEARAHGMSSHSIFRA